MRRAIQLLAVFALLAAPATTYAAKDNDVQVHSSDMGYTIAFPKDWQTGSGWAGEDVYALAPLSSDEDQFHENVTVLVDYIGNRTLDEFYDLNVNGLEMIANSFKLVDSGKTKIDGTPARWLIFTHEAGTFEFEVLQFLMVHGETAYAVTATATKDEFAKYRPVFEKIAKSFKFTAPVEQTMEVEQIEELEVVETPAKAKPANNKNGKKSR